MSIQQNSCQGRVPNCTPPPTAYIVVILCCYYHELNFVVDTNEVHFYNLCMYIYMTWLLTIRVPEANSKARALCREHDVIWRVLVCFQYDPRRKDVT